MRAWILAVVIALFSHSLYAQEQMAVRLNESGMMKILQMVVQYNTGNKSSKTIVIPQNIYKFTIPQSALKSNPIIPVVNEISDLNLNRDLDFYLNTSDIKVDGTIDPKSLKTVISNSNDKGFDLKVSLSLPSITIDGSRLSLCEDKQRNSKNCGNVLKATLSNLKIQTKTRPVNLTATLRLRTDGQVARVTVLSVDSNLEGKGSPNLDINFGSITIPKISIVIDGQETELDTSRLKDEILKRKTFLATKLLAFAGDFIANDVAEMVNVYLVSKEVATSYQIYRRGNPATFNEFLNQTDIAGRSGTFVRPPVIANKKDQEKNPVTVMIHQISEVIRNAQVGISLKKIATPGNKDIELSALLNLMLNNRVMNVRNTLGNSNKPLPALNLAAHRGHDINLAISEPLINGALDVVNSTGLFNEMMASVSDVKGFSIKSIKLHFYHDRAIVGVVNAQVDLKKLQASGITSFVKNKIAAHLERNNNNAVIYFPIEVMMVPVFKTLPNGGAGLDLRVLSPFNYVNLPNRYNYPTNVPEMTDTVKDGVMEQLKEAIGQYMNQTYSVDLTKFLNQAGVEFKPKSISINQASYLLINLDITDIKFNSKNPNKR